MSVNAEFLSQWQPLSDEELNESESDNSPPQDNGNGHHPQPQSVLNNQRAAVKQELRQLAQQTLDSLDLDFELRALSKRTLVGFTVVKNYYNQVRLQVQAERKPSNESIFAPAPEETAELEAAAKIKQDRDAAIQQRALEIAEQPDIVKLFQSALYDCKGYIANETLVGIIVTSHVSRLLSKSTGYLICGASASGKSELVVKAADFLPPDTVKLVTSCSDQALFYMGDLSHKYFVGGELKLPKPNEPDDPWQQAFRQLISEDKIVRSVVEKNEHGENREVQKEARGPAAFVLTTTADTTSFNDEFINRLSIVQTDDTNDMTKRVLAEQAKHASTTPDPIHEEINTREIEAWRLFHSQLEPLKVVIPYAKQIIPNCHNITMRRVFPLLLSYIRSSALLHQANRQIDEEKQVVVANIDDYKRAYELITATAPRVTDLVSNRALIIRDKLKAAFPYEEFTRAKAQEALKMSKTAVYRFLSALTAAGCLVLNNEKGKSFTYTVTTVLPERMNMGLVNPADISLTGSSDPSLIDSPFHMDESISGTMFLGQDERFGIDSMIPPPESESAQSHFPTELDL